MAPLGGDLGERREDEAARSHAGVGEHGVGVAPHEAVEVEDVEIDLPRPVLKPRHAAISRSISFNAASSSSGAPSQAISATAL